jgi:hypothetical protein
VVGVLRAGGRGHGSTSDSWKDALDFGGESASRQSMRACEGEGEGEGEWRWRATMLNQVRRSTQV